MENEKDIQAELTQETAVEAAAEEAAAEETVVEAVVAEEAAPAEETPAAPEKKATPGKIALAVAAVVVLAAALIALVVSGFGGKEENAGESVAVETTAAETVPATVPADGNPGDTTCKGTYTVTDEEVLNNRETVVATIGDNQLTNGQLQVYYWSMVNNYLSSESGYYAMMNGALDYTRPLDTQISIEDEGLTWQQYFLKEALNFWQLYVSLAEEAEVAGMEISQADWEYLDNMTTVLEQNAASYNVTVDELMRNNFGPGAGVEEYAAFQTLMIRGKDFYQNTLLSMKPELADLEDFYTRNEAIFTAGGITKEEKFVDARHILVIPEGGTVDETGATVYTDEEWAECETKAQAILDEFLAGDKTEETFAAMATEKTQDGGSQGTGGLYQNIYRGQMVEPFETWCFDETRQYGDTGLVQTDYGYHVMYFVGSEPMWITYAEDGWVAEQSNNFLLGLAENYPMEADYAAMTLGYNSMGN